MTPFEISRLANPFRIPLLLPLLGVTGVACLLTCVRPFVPDRWARLLVPVLRLLAWAGIATTAGLLFAEVYLFGFETPLAIVALCILLVALCGALSAKRRASIAAVLVAASAAFVYLLPFGYIPRIEPIGLEHPGPPGGHVLGSKSARLLIVEFGDFQCEPCAMQESAMKKLTEEFRSTVRFEWRHFPLINRHPLAVQAAVASECASLYGSFWETKRYLFENQERLGTLLQAASFPAVPAFQMGAFRACLASRATLPIVRRDAEEARRLRLRGTPSLIIGDMVLVGTVPYGHLRSVVIRALRNPQSDTKSARSHSGSSGCLVGPSAGCGE